MIFESHAHYDDEAFDPDREELLASLPGLGIGRVVNVGASLSSSRSSIALAQKYPYIYAAIGVHPDEVGELDEAAMDWLDGQKRAEKVVAIGEIGLDYHWEKDKQKQEKQRYWFWQQLMLADGQDIPVIVHSRDACQDTMDLVREAANCGIRGVVHCFSYSKEAALYFADLGFYIGVGGVVTFKNGRKLREAVEALPLDSILLETDSPYLAPEPHRGHRNDSRHLPLIAEEIARIKGVSREEVERVTAENAAEFFHVSLTD